MLDLDRQTIDNFSVSPFFHPNLLARANSRLGLYEFMWLWSTACDASLQPHHHLHHRTSVISIILIPSDCFRFKYTSSLAIAMVTTSGAQNCWTSWSHGEINRKSNMNVYIAMDIRFTCNPFPSKVNNDQTKPWLRIGSIGLGGHLKGLGNIIRGWGQWIQSA